MASEAKPDFLVIGKIQNFFTTEPNRSFGIDGSTTVFPPNHNFINQFFAHEDIVQLLGTINRNSLHSDPLIVYQDNIDAIMKERNLSLVDSLVHEIHGYLNVVLSSLWFVKDNSCFTASAYFFNDRERTIEYNIRNIFWSNAEGNYEWTGFNEGEVRSALKYLNALDGIMSDVVVDAKHSSKVTSPSKLPTAHLSNLNKVKYNFDRISRAYYMLGTARSQSMLPIKISFYMGVVECLFSNDNMGLADKVGQRVALYIGGPVDQQLRNYKTIKDAYGVRSKYMHGDNVKEGLEKLAPLSVSVDDLLRQVFVKILNDGSANFLEESKITDFYNSLVFR